LIFSLIGFLLCYLRRRRSSDMVGPEPSGTQNGGHDAIYANSGSRTTVQVSPFGGDLGHSLTSSYTVSPFPYAAYVGHASSNIRTAASPFPGKATGNSVSFDDSRSSSSPDPPTTSTWNTDSLYYRQVGVPPAYETLSTHRHSNLPTP
jgi:hypothetical protein